VDILSSRSKSGTLPHEKQTVAGCFLAFLDSQDEVVAVLFHECKQDFRESFGSQDIASHWIAKLELGLRRFASELPPRKQSAR
jgi:hypothetical protein